MEIEKQKLGKEYDFCECGLNGDDAILFKVKGTDKFICSECFDKYKNALNLVRKQNNKYK